MRRGTVVRVRLDPTEGSEQAGVRPAVVVSPTIVNERSPIVIVAPITSKKTDRVFRFEAMLDHEACRLSQPSKAQLNQLRAIDRRRVLGTYGVADDETMEAVDAAIRIATGLIRL